MNGENIQLYTEVCQSYESREEWAKKKRQNVNKAAIKCLFSTLLQLTPSSTDRVFALRRGGFRVYIIMQNLSISIQTSTFLLGGITRCKRGRTCDVRGIVDPASALMTVGKYRVYAIRPMLPSSIVSRGDLGRRADGTRSVSASSPYRHRTYLIAPAEWQIFSSLLCGKYFPAISGLAALSETPSSGNGRSVRERDDDGGGRQSALKYAALKLPLIAPDWD